MRLRIKIMAMLIALFSISAISNEASAQRVRGNVSISNGGGPGYDRYDDGPRMRRGQGHRWHRRPQRYAPPRYYSQHHHRGHRGHGWDRRSGRGRYDNDRSYNGNNNYGNRGGDDNNWQNNGGGRRR